MTIDQFLAPADVLLNLQVADSTSLLRNLAARAATATKLPKELILDELTKREALGSTGTGEGIAIPHTRLARLSQPYGVFARLRRAIDFNAVDGRPVDLVFLLLLPDSAAGNHLNALASVARKLRDKGTREKIRKAADSAALLQALTAE